MKLVNKILDIFILALACVAGVALGFLLLAICYATFSRFVFNYPLSSLIEYSSYSLLYITFLAGPWLLKQRRHISIDMILVKLKSRARAAMQLATNTLGFALCSTLFYFGYLVTLSNFQRNIRVMDSMATPQWLIVVAIPIGMFFMAVQFLRHIMQDIQALRQTEKGES